ncbi:MBL fold metallo-hydrolase [Geomicrobium sp. JSM 1781026]|uniref:MBL fold metallo-hydrolase n=1 Tax=Geomicrobium sp. JSM 1781026 TaxID=3344580 RepID=UPI0035C26D2D
MKWSQVPLGPIQTNAYVLQSNNQEAIIFDPGGDGEAFEKAIRDASLKPLAILLTHAHFDHIGAVDHIRDAFSVPVYVHQNEAEWLMDDELNRSRNFLGGNGFTVKPADQIIKEEGQLTIGDFSFQILETPGHSPGSVSYYHSSSETVFSGDVLFQSGIGRTDLPGGDEGTLMTTIHQKLITLPESTHVAPGHGPATTIGAEMDQNPFLNGL